MRSRFLTACLVLGLLLSPCACAEASSDAEQFRQEYEVMNGQTTLDGEHTYQILDIPEGVSIVCPESDEMRALLDEGTGVLYLGFPECPWCRTLHPVLFEALEETGFDGNLYYYNALQERDARYLDEDGNVVVEKEGSELYRTMLERMDAWLDPYPGLNDPSIKRILFPTTVFLRDGEILDVHCVTVASQTDGYAPLTDDQHDELLSSLTESIRLVF